MLKRHVSKALGKVAHAHSREKEEIVNQASAIFQKAHLISGRVHNERAHKTMDEALAFSRDAKKELGLLSRESERLSTRIHSEKLAHLIERSVSGIGKMEETISKMESLSEAEFAKETHTLARMMEEEKANISQLHSMIGKIKCNQVAHALFEVEKAKLIISELEADISSVRAALTKEKKVERTEILKSHIVNAMVAAQSGKLLIDERSVSVKSDFNTREEAFYMGGLMQEALSGFFEGEGMKKAFEEMGQGKHHVMVGNFKTEFLNGEAHKLKLSIGKREVGTEGLSYRPVSMELERRHLEEAGRRRPSKPLY